MKRGVYTLANDNYLDSLIALLNSIKRNNNADIQVCIIPFDSRISKVKKLGSDYENVTIFNSHELINKWLNFTRESIPHIFNNKKARLYNTIRKFCVFDGPFDEFVFMDADTILLSSLEMVFDKLKEYDFMAYDYQYTNIEHVYNLDSQLLLKVFPKEKIEKTVFCSGFFASKKNLFDEPTLRNLSLSLNRGEEFALHKSIGDQPILNYMVMKSGCRHCNLINILPEDMRTGNAVTAKHFIEKDNLVYDKGNRLLYIHYIGISADSIRKLCRGEDINIPYRNTLLYYRFMNNLSEIPVLAKGKGLTLLEKAKIAIKQCLFNQKGSS